MKFIKIPYYIQRLRSISFAIYNKLEYNNNPNIDTNGEAVFLHQLLKNHANQRLTVFDIGANKGDYTQLLLDTQRIYGVECKISAFEPTKKSYQNLQKRFETQSSVQLFNYGISDADTQAQIFYEAEGSTLASLYERDLSHIRNQQGAEKLSEIIDLKTLKTHIIENNITKIDFLKIDIEGNELRAFEGLDEYLTPDFIKVIQFEYGGANLDAGVLLKQLFEILEKSGFVLYKITPRGLEKRTYHPNLEMFQYANYVALSAVELND